MDIFTAKLSIAKDVFIAFMILMLVGAIFGFQGIWFITLSAIAITGYLVIHVILESAMKTWARDGV